MNKTKGFVWIACLGLAAVALLGYWPALKAPYIALDDPDYILNNPQVQQGLSWSTVVWAFTSVDNSNWHPLSSLSHAAVCQWHGLGPFGQHLWNVILHALNSVLAFYLFWRMTGSFGRSLAVGLLLAIHPLHVESVAWISERKDGLSGFFFLLTLLAYTRYVGKTKIEKQKAENGKRFWRSGYYWLALFWFACGLMSKPMLVTVPCVLMLLDVWPLQRFWLSDFRFSSLKPLVLEKLPFLVLAAGSCLVTLWAQSQAISSVEEYPLLDRLAHVPVAYAWYALKFFLPAGQSISHVLHGGVLLPQLIGAVLLLAGISTLAWRWRQSRPFFGVGWLMFLVMLVPVIGLVQAGCQAYAERYTYLPYLGLSVCVVWLLPAGSGRSRLAQAVGWSLAVLVGAVGLRLTRAQVQLWCEPERLFQQAVEQDGRNQPAWLLKGLQYALRGDQPGNLARAEECFRQVIALNPQNGEAWYDLGLVLRLQERPAEAHAAFESALQQPIGGNRRAQLHRELGLLGLRLGKTAEAIENLQQSLQMNPRQPDLWPQTAAALVGEHRLEAALATYDRWQEVQGPAVGIYLGRADVHTRLGQMEQAMQCYRQALALQPDEPATLNNLAWMLATQPDSGLRSGQEAVQLAEAACRLTGFQETVYLGTLAAAYAEAGDFTAAVDAAQRACALAEQKGQGELLRRNRELLEQYRNHLPARQ